MSKIPSSFYLLTFIFLLQIAFGMDHKCLGAQNYSTINDLYGTNLNELSAYLSYQVSATGFALGTNGQGVDYQEIHIPQIDRGTWYYEKNPQNMTNYQKITEKKGEWLT
ncbi:hypothetical protein CFP56_034101 [Quercus suber]|uniref:Uncharacterized protein n=1 Tax=Quercus suber TaxID=58331 RepID=A0AAW0LR10_QUESU